MESTIVTEQKEKTCCTGTMDAYKGGETNSIDEITAKYKSPLYRPIPTGIEEVDRILGGGFCRQELVWLLGAPGVGKTAFTQQVFEAIAAKNSIPVMYFNLEMSLEQLVARSLARSSYAANAKTALTVVDIMRGYDWSVEQEQKYNDAFNRYKREIDPHLKYNPISNNSCDIDDIIDAAESSAKENMSHGRTAPILVIDYLQILSARNSPSVDTAEKIGYICSRLKSYAIRYNSMVFVITAQGRSANDKGRPSMSGARDSSNIEYAGDRILALTHARYENKVWKDISPDEAIKLDTSYIRLTLTKGRACETHNATAYLSYRGEYSYFLTVNNPIRGQMAAEFDKIR